MFEFIKSLNIADPLAQIIIFIAVVLFLIVVVLYIIAFVQGREVSFWPPKIGAKNNHDLPPRLDSARQRGNGNTDDKFDIPSMLVSYKYGEKDKEGFFDYESLRVYTLRALSTEDFLFVIPKRSTNKVERDVSVSDITDTKTEGIGTYSSISQKVYRNNYFGKHYINVSMSKWRVRPGIRSKPNPEDIIQNTLYDKILLNEKHDYIGTRIVAKTERLRILINFNRREHVPKQVLMVQIYEDGTFKEKEPRVEIVEEKKLVIVEVDKLDSHSGIYVHWIWA
ncbi:MAG: hypothetical protein D3925_12540 [Candidatus Electrothrix sp. AR5]|nr:hypothetical protein [Candidatus Electrothrix sp. AR5]